MRPGHRSATIQTMKLAVAITAVLIPLAALAAEAPPSAATLLENARAEAARSHRAIWVLFDASW